MKKLLAVGVIVLFLGVSVIPSTGTTDVKQSATSTSDGNILYVGGSGPNNYTKIQDAIDDANPGDTVFVYNGTYYEGVHIYKSINLIGEDRNTTIIGGPDLVVFVKNSNNVNIQSFTIVDGGHIQIIFEHSSNCTFYNNIVQTNGVTKSVLIYYSSEIKILKNYITSDWLSIEVGHSQNCIIENNYLGGNEEMSYWSLGIGVAYSTNITVIHNHISRCFLGIDIRISGTVCVIQNNFIENIRYARFDSKNLFNIFWDGNYWGRPRLLPRPVLGWLFIIPIVQFDWRPAKEPYDIGV